MTEKYRGYTISLEYPQIPIRDFDYIASDPNGEGEMIAHGETVAECKADIDRYHEENDDAVRSEV